MRGASDAAMQMLLDFDWPGNVRQLENTVFRAVILCEGDLLQPEDFPQISGLKPLAAANDARPHNVPAPANDHVEQNRAALTQVMSDTVETHPSIAIFDDGGHLRQLEIDRTRSHRTRDRSLFRHMSEVARRLGIGRARSIANCVNMAWKNARLLKAKRAPALKRPHAARYLKVNRAAAVVDRDALALADHVHANQQSRSFSNPQSEKT